MKGMIYETKAISQACAVSSPFQGGLESNQDRDSPPLHKLANPEVRFDRDANRYWLSILCGRLELPGADCF